MSMRVEVRLHPDRLLGELEALTPEALAAGGEVIRAAAAPKTPVETGRLVGSAAVVDEGDDAVAVVYDGPYARYQHERLDLRHETGQAKYLEMAVIESGQDAVDAMAKVLRGDS